MATVDVGGAGSTGQAPTFARSLLAQQDARYRGYTQQALRDQWMPVIDPIKAMLEQARRDEELRRALHAAEAPRITPTGLPPMLALPQSQLIPTGQFADPQANPLLPQAPAVPHGADPLATNAVTQGRAAALGSQTSVSDSLSPTPHGADPALNSGAVALAKNTAAGAAINDMPPSFIDQQRDKWMSRADQVVAEDATAGMMPWEAYAARTGQQVMDDALSQYPGVIAAARKATYGDAIPVTDLNGDTRFEYSTKDLTYYGITEKLQREGWIPAFNPDELNKGPGPHATDEEKRIYAEKVATALRPPQWKIGDSASYIFGLDRQEKIGLQKRLRAAGYYKSGAVITPGVFSEQDVAALQGAMGFSNQTGLDLDAGIQLRAQAVARARAAAKARAGGGGSGPITHQVQITYSPTSMAQGRAMLAGVLGNALGRAPTDSELSEFMSRLNAAENRSPVRTVTNYVRSGGSMTSTSRTHPSKVDPEQMAREFAQDLGGGQEIESHKATEYMDKLINMLMGMNNG